MKHRSGSRFLSLLLTAAMVLSLIPATTIAASAATLPNGANTPGKGYYPNAAWDTAQYTGTDAPTADSYKNRTLEDWKKIYSNIKEVKASDWSAGKTVSAGVYYISENISVTGSTDQSGLVISGDVTLIIPDGVTLTAKGGNATNGGNGSANKFYSYGGRAGVGAGAGIQLTSGNTLHILGSGTVNATGGNAGNGGNGGNTSVYEPDQSLVGGGGGGGGGGGAAAGIGTKGGAGGTGGSKANIDTGGSTTPGNGGSSNNSGTLIVTGNVTVIATGGTAGTSGAGGTAAKPTAAGKSAGAGGGGGAGGAAYNIGSGGAGGGGGGAGNLSAITKRLQSPAYNEAGGGGGGGGSQTGTGGTGGAGGFTLNSSKTTKNGEAGRSGTTAGGSGGKTAQSSSVIDYGQTGGNSGSLSKSGSYYHRAGLTNGDGINNYTIWPKDECKFEVVADTTTGYDNTNGAWMYKDNTVFKPSIKITHIPSGQTKTVNSSAGGYTFGSGTVNIFGSNGYGWVKVSYNTSTSGVRLVPSNADYSKTNANQTLYFPIKETVSFDDNAKEQKANLISQGFTTEEAVVSDMPEDKVLQVGVTEKTDEVLATASVPKLPGYTFLGWYYYNSTYFDASGDLDMSKALDSNKNPTGVRIYNADGKLNEECGKLNANGTWNGVDGSKAITTLYAMWKEADLTVTLDAQGGQGGSSTTGLKFGSYVQVLAPTKPGSTFDGYYTGKNGTGDLICYVDSDKGEMVYKYTMLNGTTGYHTAAEINSDNSGKGGGLKVTRAYYLYAKWAPLQYDIPLYSLDNDSPDGAAHLVGTLKDVRYGTLRVPNVSDKAGFKTETADGTDYGVLDTDLNMSRDHYDFIGWNIYDGQDWAMFKPDEIYKTGLIQTTADGTSKALYAAWKIKDNYKIYYNGNGGVSGETNGNVFKGEDYTVSDGIPTREGYTFTGWNTAQNGSGTNYNGGDKITGVTENITLFAQWQENKSVVYDTNGGTASTSLPVLKPAKGATVDVNFTTTVQKAGYDFIGWDTNPYGKDGTQENPSKDATYTKDGTTSFPMGDEAVTLYAIWAPKQFSITYAATDDTQAQRYTQNTKPDKYYHLESYTFDVRVDTNTVGANAMTVSINGSNIAIPQPTTEGTTQIYTFTITGATGEQKIVIGGLTARSFNVTLDAMGGTIAAGKNVTYYVWQEGVDALPGADDVTRTGYTFVGWYDNADGTGSAVTSIGTDATGDKTYYAKWTPNTYTVKYDANGGNGTVESGTATYDTPYTVKDSTGLSYSSEGVKFLGWSTNRDAVTPEYKVRDTLTNLADGKTKTEITLYAVWEVPSYHIYYNLMGGTADGNATMEAGVVKTGTDYTVQFPESMTRKGYNFVGWDENQYGKDGTEDGPTEDATYTKNGATEISNVTANQTLYAVWEPITYSIVFKASDTGAGTKQENIKYGDQVKLAVKGSSMTAPDESKNVFLGWATVAGATTPQYLDEQQVKNLCDTQDAEYTLYAVWGTEEVKYLNYDANGGTYSQAAGGAPEATPASAGIATVQFAKVPTMEGYDFAGWQTSDGGTLYTEESANKDINLSENVTLYAKWEAKHYTVKFHPNTGSDTETVVEQEIPYDKSTQLTANSFSRDGYIFLGWSESADATSPTYQDGQHVLNMPVEEGVEELYAVWQQEDPIYIIYNANGGTGAPASDSVAKSTTYVISSHTPTREGYTFLGWSTLSDTTTALYTAGYQVTDGFVNSVTLYAVWERKQGHTVTYVAEGSYGSVPVDSNSYYEGDGVTVRFTPVPMKSGYTFTGWTNGDSIYTQDNNTFTMGTDNVTLTAKWQANTYTILFKNDSTAEKQENVQYGDTVKLRDNPFTAQTGYEFAGWATNEGGSVVYADKAEVSNLTAAADGEVTLYAVWTPVTVAVTFDKQQGEGGTDSISATYGQQLPSASVPYREGYDFGGYYADKACTGKQYYNEYMVAQSTADFTQNTTLYAKWTAKTYKVTYMQGAEAKETDDLTYDKTTTIRNAAILDVPTGMKLAGWAKQENGSVLYTAGQTNVDLWDGGSDVVLYAVFKKDVKYTVTYHPGYGNTFPVDTNQYDDGDTVTVELDKNQPTQYGYTFLGWSDEPNQSTAKYNKGGLTQFNITKDTDLYAVWSTGTYSVTYNGNGGELNSGATATYDNVEMLRYSYNHMGEIYTRNGYTLLGWAKSKAKANLGQIDYALNQQINPDLTNKAGDAITLYAVWQANQYTVTFEAGAGAKVSETQREVTFGQKYGAAFPTPTREGYVFGGWYATQNPGEDATPVTNMTEVTTPNDHNLYAKWNAMQFSITTKNNGFGTISLTDADGNAITDQADAGTEITVTVAPRENYTIDNVTLYVNGTPVSMKGAENNTYTFTLNQKTEVALKSNGNTGAKYTVKYDNNNGTGSVDDTACVVGQSVTLSDGSGFTRTGYNLTGWNTKADGKGTTYALGSEQTSALTLTAGDEVTLYAQWSATDCTVTFDAKGGTVAENSKAVTYGKPYGTLPTPTKTGSVFGGWYLSETYGEGELVSSDTIVANADAHTLYAKWVSAQYTVTVNENGVGTITLTGVDESNKAAAGTEITVTVSPRENYTIDNVKLYVNGNPVQMENGSYQFTLNKDAIVSLEENANIGIKYTVAYVSNDGEGNIASADAVTGAYLTLADNGFTKSGATLTGWNTKQDGTGESYKLGAKVKDLTYTPGETVTLYAQWSENDPAGYEYTIRYEANGGNGDAYVQTMHQNRLDVALYDGADFSRSGYALVGWANTPNGTVDYQLGGKLSAPLAQSGATKTLYAVWEKGAIRVTLVDEQGVSSVTSLVLKTGDTYAKLPNLTKTGYTFDGWFTEATGGDRVDNNTEVTATADHTLYAHWTQQADKTYTVTTQENGLGTITLNPAQNAYQSGTEITVTVEPAEGKTVKLISNVSGEIALTGNTGSFTVTADTVLALVDESTIPSDPSDPTVAENAWFLFYNGNGGTGSMEMQTVAATATAKDSEFTREGYNFAGWNTKADGSGTTYAVGKEISKPANSKTLTLYAQWEATAENTFTVTFDAQGGTMTGDTTRTYHAGDKYGTLPEPVKSGDWSFGGWYSDSALKNRVYSNTEVLAKNHTLYAKWVSRTAIGVTAVGYTGEYDGSPHALIATPSKTLTGATYQWFKDGNAIAGATGKTYYVKNVADSGKYTCLVSGSLNGVRYTDLESTTAVVSITRKQLTVTAANATTLYGSDAPAYAMSYSGFAATDDASVLKGEAKVNCAYVKGNDANEYDITIDASGLTAGNYTVKTVDGKLTVKPLPVSLEWSGTKLEANGSEQSITATVKNAVGSDTFTLAYTGNTGTAVDSYSAEVTALGNDNYTLTGATGVKHNWVIYEQGKNPTEVPDPVQPNEPEKAVTGIVLDPTSKTLKVNEEFTLTYTLQPEGANDTVTFASSDNSIVSVDASGKVTAKASGTAVITATTSGGLTATCTVTVSAKAPEGPTPVTGITIQYTSYKLTKAGQNFNVGAKVQPNDATNQKIHYSSSNNAVATVDATGKVTAISSGTATIYAQTDDGGYTLICTVTVEISSSGTGGTTGGGGTSGGGGSSSGGSGSGTNGGNISAGGTGNTAYTGCKHDKNCPIAPFGDTFANAWYHNGVHYCIDNGLMGGYGNGMFGPNDKISRAQIVTILWRIAGSPTVNYSMNFTDILEGSWYGEAVRWATSVGVASGYGEGKFGPDDSITREQFAAMLYRFAKLQGKDTSMGENNTLNGFTDVGEISGYAKTAMQWANGLEIISGTDNSTLMPKGNATRAQAACMIQRYIVNLAK